MASSFYQELTTRVMELEVNLLPPVHPTQLQLSQRDIDLTSSYLILAVAEIETYIESHLADVCSRAEAIWTSEGKVTRSAKALVLAKHIRGDEFKASDGSFFCGAFEIRLTSRARGNLLSQMGNALKRSFESFRKKLEDNNGPHGLRKLLFPVGMYEDQLDAILLNNLDALAKTRGFPAHNSVANAARVELHPSAARTEVQNVIKSLACLDDRLSNFE